MGLIITFIIVFILSLIAYVKRKKTNQPHMPIAPGWPIVGSIFHVNRQRPDLSFIAWGRQLGPVYTVNMLNESFVVVSGYDEIIEVLVSKGTAFGGRAFGAIIEFCTYGFKGILVNNANAPDWSEIKNAVCRSMRHYTDGLKPYLTITKDFVDSLHIYHGTDVDLENNINSFVLKVAVTMLSGKMPINDTDEVLARLTHLGRISVLVSQRDGGFQRYLFPWLRFIRHKAYKEALEIVYLRDQLWDLMWYCSRETYSSNGDATCILHAIGQLLDKNSSHYKSSVTWENARAIFLDIIVSTVSILPNFAYLFPKILIHNHRVFQRLRTEVDKVLGADRQPSLADSDSMNYTMATVYELLRYGSLLPTLPHTTLENTSVGTFVVPKDTIILPLFTAIQTDPEFWGDPDTFRPERFLDEKGSLLHANHPRRKHMIQFGAGIRKCIGEGFATMRLFIFITRFVQLYNILPANNILDSINPKNCFNGITLKPCSYKVRLVPRYPSFENV